MGSMPPARRRARKDPAPMAGRAPRPLKRSASTAGFTPSPPNPPVPLVGAAALPPIPASYILLLIAMLLGVLALYLQGATLIEAVMVVEVLMGAIAVLVWRLRK